MDIEHFGGKGDGKTDNALVLTRLSDASTARAVKAGLPPMLCVIFDAGIYEFSSTWSYALPEALRSAVIIEGAGSGATILRFESDSGLNFTLHHPKQTLHMRGLTLVTNTSSGSGAALKITQTSCLGSFDQSTFSDITFEGLSGGQFWGVGADVVGLSGTAWHAVTAYGDTSFQHGIGIRIRGNNIDCGETNGYSIYHNITSGIFNQLSKGVVYDDFTQGITVTQSNFQNSQFGIWSPPETRGQNMQLNVSNSQFQVSDQAISLNSPINLGSYSNNTVLISSGKVGFSLGSSNINTVSGNTFAGVNYGSTPSAVGIDVSGTATMIAGNSFSALRCGYRFHPNALAGGSSANTFNATSPACSDRH
ncbi:hypothetical protein ABC766_03100 [Methylobacterium fujisawaense]|uniref:hypothetical protein n=1 Tax=Methylobacterium fujisawaense TaxID=107400 RepID=UPI0031F57795